MDEYVDPSEDQSEDEEALNELIEKARSEFEIDKENTRENNEAAYDDIRFVTLPEEQWLQTDREAREKAGRPCPTLARLSPFIKQVANDIRLNKPGIHIKPAESDDVDKSEIIEGIIRHIEVKSDASSVYASWSRDMVTCGIGHSRVLIEPSESNPELMDLRIDYIPDPLSVIWDKHAVKLDRSDARRCFVVDYLPKSIVDENYEDALGDWPSADDAESWTDWYDDQSDEVRVCEVYRVVSVDEFEYIEGPEMASEKVTGRDNVPEGARIISKSRTQEVRMWIMTAGKILEGGLEGIRFPGRHIPIVPAIADEQRIGRTLVRKGMVRDAKDSVRLLNWSMALLVEAMAASPKPKWVGPAQAFEGLEEEWDNAASPNKPWIAYKGGTAPQYVDPPKFNSSLVQAMQVFDENIKQVTGIYDASLGARSNETSGVAIRQREQQGDVATFDYIDNFVSAIQSLGRILVGIIPEVYSQERTIRIVGREDEETVVTLNQQDDATGQIYNAVESLAYDVVVESGPSFSTRRQEAAEGVLGLIKSMPNAGPLLADILAKMQDWPNADKIAERLAVLLPPELRESAGYPMPPQPPPPPEDPEKMAKAAKYDADALKTRQDAESVALDNEAKKFILADKNADPFAEVNYTL